MSDDELTISFPCEDYPIKILGESSATFRDEVLEIVRQFDESVTDDKVTENNSSGGKYLSVRILFRATGEDQLRRLFEALKAHGAVRMVL